VTSLHAPSHVLYRRSRYGENRIVAPEQLKFKRRKRTLTGDDLDKIWGLVAKVWRRGDGDRADNLSLDVAPGKAARIDCRWIKAAKRGF
jgi:hypothetical protein